jgi:hypothetical protein
MENQLKLFTAVKKHKILLNTVGRMAGRNVGRILFLPLLLIHLFVSMVDGG